MNRLFFECVLTIARNGIEVSCIVGWFCQVFKKDVTKLRFLLKDKRQIMLWFV